MEEDLNAICNECEFSGHPDEFDAALSAYHDLRCPKCGTTNIRHSYGSYKNNTLVLRND